MNFWTHHATWMTSGFSKKSTIFPPLEHFCSLMRLGEDQVPGLEIGNAIFSKEIDWMIREFGFSKPFVI